MPSNQRGCESKRSPGNGLQRERGMVRLHFEMVQVVHGIEAGEARPLSTGYLTEELQKPGVVLGRHHGDAGLDDTGLLASDRFGREAEVVGMVLRDVGDDRADRIHDVGRIQATPQSDLDHSHIQASLGEKNHAQHRRGLEEGETTCKDHLAQRPGGGFERSVVQGPSLYLIALSEVNEVR